MPRYRKPHRNFTIVSNNCWGASLYSGRNVPYATPFIGLFLNPDCYLHLLNDFTRIIRSKLSFKQTSQYQSMNCFRAQVGTYPIGSLAEKVEIHFQHYLSEAEALEKWNRRVSRICEDENQLFLKFCDRNGATEGQIKEFDSLPFKNKVCFVSKRMDNLASTVYIPGYHSNGEVPDGRSLEKVSEKFFDANGWLDGSDGVPTASYMLSSALRRLYFKVRH